jgi:hypothetical protein
METCASRGVIRGKSVEVFRTNVHQHHQALMLVALLTEQFPLWRINFDLHDCDKILRIEGEDIVPHSIVRIIAAKGYQCGILE